MRKIITLFCLFFALTSCTNVVSKKADIDQVISFNIPSGLNKLDCSNPDGTPNDTPDVQCFQNIAGTKSLTIIKTPGDLSTAVYSDPSAGEEYKYYAQYDLWIENHSLHGPQFKEAQDCLERNKSSQISLNIIPRTYAAGGEFNCDDFLKQAKKGAQYVFMGGDGPGAWNTVFIESTYKKSFYQINCMVNFGGQEPPVSENGGTFLKECINTVLGSFPDNELNQ